MLLFFWLIFQWANTIAETMDRVHSSEINRRKHFSSRFEGHFLSGLFPGLEDFPPLFASKKAEPFDINLPTVNFSIIINY